MQILAVEDDQRIAQAIRQTLLPYHSVTLAGTIHEGEHLACQHSYDLILMDMNLPDGTGISLCQKLRSYKVQAPILMVTGERNLLTKVKALEVGADDYLLKPFARAELRARVQALTRRPKHVQPCELKYEDLVLDSAHLSAKRGNVILKLRPKEWQILERLLQQPEHLVRRETLLELFEEDENATQSNTLDAHIKNLRRKVDGNFEKKLIQTVYGKGYVLQGRGESASQVSAKRRHDLATPLTGLMLSLELLEEDLKGGKNAEAKKHLKSMKEAVKELERLIKV